MELADQDGKLSSKSKSKRTATAGQRVFCGWSEPLLVRAADWLLNHAKETLPAPRNPASQGNDAGQLSLFGDETLDPASAAVSKWDLSDIDVILPSSRAVDRLREILLDRADTEGAKYQPPRFYLVGRLPSLLYRRPAEWASDFEQTLAWARVLSQSDPSDLQTLVPTPPEPDATSGWIELASTAGRLLSSLASENLAFEEVAQHAENPNEQKRWEFLIDVQKRYQAELRKADRCDPDLAELDAIAEKKCRALRPIVLVGTSDLSELAKAMLAKVDVPITALIAAPQDLAERFDRFGCLITKRWTNHELPLEDEQLIAADSVEDQATAVTEVLTEFGKTFATDSITIGATNESQVAPIENQCRRLEVPTYRQLGYTVTQTSVGRLLDLVITYRSRRTWRSLAALVRHSEVHSMISQAMKDSDTLSAANWLTKMDQLLAEAFPRTVDRPLPALRQETKIAEQILDCVEKWLGKLDQKRRPIGQWSGLIQEILKTVYPDVNESPEPSRADPSRADPSHTEHSRTKRAFQSACNQLQTYSELSSHLDTPVDVNTALEMLSARIQEAPLKQIPSPEKIDILGWLDLALDDAPALVVCGLNHPFVPEASSGDPFLPSSLQSLLNQRNNDRRYARDVHAMHQMLTSRRSVRFIVGKRGADESPTPPSRLLAAASADDAARRVCSLLSESRPKVNLVSANADKEISATVESSIDYFRPPPPKPGHTTNTLSVTAFSAYLSCPYRFYLRHVLRMRPLDDSALELAANQFGDLVHGALEYFGESDQKDEPDPDKISAALIDQLHRYADEHYGDNTQATIAIQIRQAERRLKTVAERQAERIAQGWRIHAVEASVDEKDVDENGKPKKPTGIILDGEFTGLRGRFDRIDHHPGTGQWAILDYKTHGHVPEKKHLKTGLDGSTKWVDLQLPLYRRFIPDLGIEADPKDVQLGYFNVAEKDTETKINLAPFTEDQFAAADELIHWCVQQIRDCRFEPNPDGVQYDDYEMMFNESDRGWTVPEDEAMEVLS